MPFARHCATTGTAQAQEEERTSSTEPTKRTRKRTERRARGEGAVFWSASKDCWVWRAVTGSKPRWAVRSRLEALYLLAVGTGPRQGELLALEREGVGTAASTVRIVKALDERAGVFTPNPPKSETAFAP